MHYLLWILDATIAITALGSYVVILLKSRGVSLLHWSKKILFSLIGFIALFLDTIGVGSFASSMAMVKATKSIKDEMIPAYLNLMQVLPNGLEAILFLSIVKIDWITFFTLVAMSVIGGYLSGKVSHYLPVQKMRIGMVLGLLVVAVLLILTLFKILPSGGTTYELHGIKLLIGAIIFFAIGILPAIGVGNYAAMQIVLFLLGMTPLAVFPIMTASAAFQEVALALFYVKQKGVPLKESAMAGAVGCLGVVAAFLMLKHFTPEGLHGLLFGVILLNIILISRSWYVTKKNSMR